MASSSSSSSSSSLPQTPMLSPWRHTAALLTLCFTLFTQVYMVTSAFPYSGFMAMALLDDVNTDNAGFYAGAITSAVLLGRSFGYFWGLLSDTYGRIPAIQASCVVSAVTCLLFGLTSSYGMAVLLRFLLGLANALFTIARVCVSELARGDKKRETNDMNFLMSIWGVATLLAPALSGAIVEPVKRYPHVAWLQSGPWFRLFGQFPFLPPNLVAAGFCLLTMILVQVFVPETLPSDIRRPVRDIAGNVAALVWKGVARICGGGAAAGAGRSPPFFSEKNNRVHAESTPLLHPTTTTTTTSTTTSTTPSLLSQPSKDTTTTTTTTRTKASLHVAGGSHVEEEEEEDDEEEEGRVVATTTANTTATTTTTTTTDETTGTKSSLLAQSSVRIHMIVACLLFFLFFQFDQAFPLYCISESAGLGVSEKHIGEVLGISSVLFVMAQLWGYGPLLDRLGLYGCLRLVPFALVPVAALLPVAGVLNRNATNGGWNWSTLLYLSLVMAVYKVACSTIQGTLSVAMNRLVPSSQLGSLNGMLTTVSSFVETVGIVFSGILSAAFYSQQALPPFLASILLWTTIALLNAAAATFSYRWMAMYN